MASATSSDKLITVLNDPENFNAKHPLQSSWTLWYTGTGTTQDSWSQQLTVLTTVSTVEDFWGAYNNLVPVQQLETGSSYYFFREGVKPEWEDPHNTSGGAWVIQIMQPQRSQDDLFLNTLLATIGSCFQRHDEICGIIFAARRVHNRISVWTKTASDKEAQESLGTQLRELLGCSEISFKNHQNSTQSGKSYSYKV
ncbi:hypothetical protein CXG81DRAFT_29762 [Caulochytrium protostelioides]|uniref:Translation initiation factor eIF4e n=1 Tax=Caulochytrium protostelioides TaxID=1555241 RepID=A0A4P9X816_9FUNG|nr:translation initiation factor eIF4e [Caulochytrium protostelioides]RKP01388.1 hypothetical protein CXG81DRAFT_29762 [Caulochytrium protostelioides]|eukprot:RKP01388.1 hypothetical protein CXG81DRAFT_29762 [Caulochytrium protostelioides]